MKEARQQLAEWDRELDRLHTQNGDLDLQVQCLQSEQKRLQTCLQDKQAELDEVRSQLSTQTASQESKILDSSPAATDCVQNRSVITEAVVALREAAKRKAGPALIKEVRVIADALAKLVTGSG